MGTEREGGGNWERRGWELREKGPGTGEKGMENGRERGGKWMKGGENWEKGDNGNWDRKGWKMGPLILVLMINK